MARTSIKDVAERAGVSTATVSHVINGTRFVREETRQTVLDAIEALHYQPSAIARGLATNSTQTIGLVISDIANPFFTAVARGVEDEINQQGLHTIFCNTDEEPAREDDYLRLLSARQIDGLIIAPTGIYSERLLRMHEADIPIVLLDRETPGLDVPIIGVDNEGGAYEATRYLIELGHRQIAILVGMETISTQRARFQGYVRAMQEQGLAIDENLVIRADSRAYSNQLALIDSPPPATLFNNQMTPNAYHALQQVLDSPHPPSAIFITNNEMTIGSLQALKERGLRCPEDISLISFDDHDWASIFLPPLTVVRQPTYQLGQTAAKLLLKLIRQHSMEGSVCLPVELIIRESCRRLVEVKDELLSMTYQC